MAATRCSRPWRSDVCSRAVCATFPLGLYCSAPKELVSKTQKDEIAFMQPLGIQSRVLTLIERD